MDEQMSSSLELLTKERDGPALAGFVVQLVGGGVDDARALLQKALAHLEPPPAATASVSAASATAAAAAAAAQTAAGGNGTSSEKKRPAPDDAVAQASNKVARAGDTSGPSSGGASSGGEVVELNYFKRDAHDDGDDRLMLLVPDNAVSNIIGKAGHTVKQIQSSTDVKVDIQTSAEMVPGQRERRVTLRGSIKNTNIGAYLVGMKVGEKLQADRPGSDMQLSMKVLVPDQSVSFIIGKQGVMINEIQSLSGGRVQIEKAAEMLPGLGGRVVTITGPARARLMAQYLISRAVAQHMAPIGGPAGGGVAGGSVSLGGGQVTMEMFVQNSLVARLIGKQGQNVTQLQTNSGAKVQIQKEADMIASGLADRMVYLVGSQAAVSKCQSLIAKQLSQWADAEPRDADVDAMVATAELGGEEGPGDEMGTTSEEYSTYSSSEYSDTSSSSSDDDDDDDDGKGAASKSKKAKAAAGREPEPEPEPERRGSGLLSELELELEPEPEAGSATDDEGEGDGTTIFDGHQTFLQREKATFNVFERKKRVLSATHIARCARGHLARQMVRGIHNEIKSRAAIPIQAAARGCECPPACLRPLAC